MISPRRGHSIVPWGVQSLNCPTCQGRLFPLFSNDTLCFYCKSGHSLEPRPPILQSTPLLIQGMAALLEEWRTELTRLEQAASEARIIGYEDIAEICSRQIPRLARRAELLATELARATMAPASRSTEPPVPPTPSKLVMECREGECLSEFP